MGCWLSAGWLAGWLAAGLPGWDGGHRGWSEGCAQGRGSSSSCTYTRPPAIWHLCWHLTSIILSLPLLPVCAGLIWKRQYGDMANLSWLRRHAMELNAQKQFMAASSSGGMGGMGGGERAQAVQVQAYQVPHPSVLPCLPGLLAWPAVHPCCLA